MIRYALICVGDHEFEAWFSSSDAFDDQRERGLVECPVCGTTHVRKQIMAPAVARSATRKTDAVPATQPPTASDTAMAATPPADGPGAAEFAKFVAGVREHLAKSSEYVGDKFADTARAISDGDEEARPIWGQASPDECEDLAAEGIDALPIPDVCVPDIKRSDKLN